MGIEIWKPVVGFESIYEVSNHGRVKSLTRIAKSERRSDFIVNERVLKHGVNDMGRAVVVLANNGKNKTRKVHQLVAESFLNHKACGMKLVIDHIDCNPLNNHVANLRIVTQRQNSSFNKKGASKYTGVLKSSTNRWMARIRIDGESVYLGSFKNELDASNVYQEKLKSINA